ncbi:MAG: carbohydrate kinase [Chitinophagaceae bacterium]|nr:MAG: carbohydrate kinase [Chitinophagaceae bacterium]
MNALNIAAVFDVGKTNKKLLLFNEQYRLVEEYSIQLPETIDEDGFPCEDVHALTNWLISSLEELSLDTRYRLRALNFTSYGASFVHLDKSGEPLGALRNYLKPYPEELRNRFYQKYGGEEEVSRITASPVLGNLNSGMQLYQLAQQSPEIFSKIAYSLHLPQYLAFVLSGRYATDITSVGCHTNLWDFTNNQYHHWVGIEGLSVKFAPLKKGNDLINDPAKTGQPPIGVGLHDSSAALIPYLRQFQKPFLLISTGTWCISMNPFNDTPLTKDELTNDCLCYLTYTGDPVKSSRLFAGNEHEKQLKRLNDHFNQTNWDASGIHYRDSYLPKLIHNAQAVSAEVVDLKESFFAQRDLSSFENYEEAYHQLIFDLVKQQLYSLKLVLNSGVKRIFVDGGFGKNAIYMHLLATSIPDIEVYASSVSQATAIGTALAIHDSWNSNPPPSDIIQLKYYSAIQRSMQF